jgi:hypothetical protein
MNDARLAFVQVQPTAEGSRASILVSDLLDTGRDPELLLKRVAETASGVRDAQYRLGGYGNSETPCLNCATI